MPRLGGGAYKQSYLVAGGSSTSQTQVLERPRTPPPRSGGGLSRRHPELGLPTMIRSESPPALVTPKTRRVHAVEPGSGSLLPDYSNSNHSSTQRSRIRTLSDINKRDCDSPSDEGLRRRSTLSLDDESSPASERRHSMSNSSSSPNNRIRLGSHSQAPLAQQGQSKGFTVGHFIQAVVVVIVFYLVYDAHYKVQEAAGRLEHYKQEEAVLIDQMDRIEDRALQLQEQLKRLRDEHAFSGETSVQQTKEQTQEIQDEIHQWKREYFEVNKEVHALQDFMQDSARKELEQKYGSGALNIILDLRFGEPPVSPITIELFDEAPHASWVFAQQVENGDWSAASFIWHPAHMVLATPSKAASVKLEFTERSYHHHEAWTIGLTKSHNGGYNLYVNLQDNSHVHEGDVCLGKVTGGFDTLQKLMHRNTVAKTPGGEKAYLDPPVPIDKFSITTAPRQRRY